MRHPLLHRIFFLLLFIQITGISITPSQAQPIWGRLANPGFENDPVKSTYFFTGNCNNDVQYYEYFPGNNMGLYTVHPVDDRHLRWSEDTAYQAFVIDDMIYSGINVVNMSIWGPRGTDNWAYWAPMQTSTYSHDELFNIALNRDILIAPYLESVAESPTGDPAFSFMNDFPGDPLNPAPNTVHYIEDLIDRYIVHPDNPLWTQKWAQMYDQDDNSRYVISLIHVASTKPGITDQEFAEGFDRLADTIFKRTGVRIGFTLDILPHNIYIEGEFRANPEVTGPYLAQQKSILAVQCFIPEVFLGMEQEDFITRWKHQFSSRWIHTGIPFIQDIAAGYDAHIVFQGSIIYGNNAGWRELNGDIVYKLLSEGITFNTWNGYTEGYAAMPTTEYGSGTYSWVNDLFGHFEPVTSLHKIPGRIEAEDWAGMAGVQTEVSLDDFEGLYVGWMEAGDYMDYNVDVEQEALYYLDMRVAKLDESPAGEAQLRIDDVPVKTVTIPGTWDWQNWQTIRTAVSLPEGKHKLSVYITEGGWNFNWMKFKKDSVEQYYPIPGKIEAENYYDMFGVVSEKCTDTDSQVDLGYLNDNDWMEYYVDVLQDDTYDLSFRVSQDAGLSDAEGELYSGNTLLCNFIIPNTGGWQNWVTVNEEVYLNQGKQKLRIHVSKAPWNINWMEFSLPVPVENERTNNFSYHIFYEPASGEPVISVEMQKPSDFKLDIFDITGRLQKVLYDGYLQQGEYKFKWNASGNNHSVYFIRMQTGNRIETDKCVLLK